MSERIVYSPFKKGNKNNLREVGTVFSIGELNEAHSRGDMCVVRSIKKNPELVITSLLLCNRRSGEYVITPSREVYGQYKGELIEYYPEYDWELIHSIEAYARAIRHEGDWGGYIVPFDAKIGERFYIGTLIEDLLATKFWDMVVAAKEAEAVWDGSDLIIDHQSYRLEIVG